MKITQDIRLSVDMVPSGLLVGTTGNDTLYGELERASAAPQPVTMLGAMGGDYLYGGKSDDLIYGGDRVYHPEDTSDYVFAGAGNDTVFGNGGDDLLEGGVGADTI